MTGMIRTIRKLLGGEQAQAASPSGSGHAPAQQVLPPEERLAHAQQNIKAITSMIDEAASDAIVLNETMEIDGKLTAVEIRADRMHFYDYREHRSKLVRLNDSLDHYQALDEELRMQLGRKIARLVPALADSKKKLLLDHTVQVLKTIASDQTERVRMMIAEEMAELPNAPYEVVQKLAWDASARVACPILEFSPLLRDEDLIDIIATSEVPGAVEAIARRASVSEDVSRAVVKSEQPVAIHQLLKNEGASIGEESFNAIIDMAPEHEFWHQSLSARPELTQKTIARIAGFISQDILAGLADSGEIKQKHKKHTRAAVTHRLNSWTEEQERQAELRVRQLHQAGRLDEERMDDFIHEVNEPYVIAALAVRALMTREKVKKILRSDSARAITALAWEAGLPMRSAMALQVKIGRIHHTKMLHARGGTDYPLSADEMHMYLDMFS